MSEPVIAASIARQWISGYVPFILIVAGFGWPFFVFHGVAEIVIGTIWLLIAIPFALLFLIGTIASSKAPSAGKNDTQEES